MRLASLKGQPCGRHPYRRPLGWRLRLGYHTGLPHVKPTPENFLLRLHVLAWIMLAGELLPWMLHFHRPWFQKNVLDMGYTLLDGNRQPTHRCYHQLQFCYHASPPDGAQASTTVYSATGTAMANCLNPAKYIRHLLTVLPEHFAIAPKAAIDDLLPWAETVQRLCRK